MRRQVTAVLFGVGVFGMMNASVATADEALAKAKLCTGCHAVDKKVVGPAYKDVAAKYAGKAGAEANAKRDAALVVGANVVSAGGRDVGKLTEVDLAADRILLESPQGMLQMRKEHFAVNPQGQLAVLYSREQIASAATGGGAAKTTGGAS